LARTTKVCGNPELEMAQLALRRSLHLSSEAARIFRVAPDAAAMAGRSAVEHAVLGSYFASYRAERGGTAGLLKKQRRNASKLREYLLDGEMLGALALLPEVSFIAAPLNPTLDNVTGTPDLRTICSLLDQREPFKEGNIATRIYYETYAALSNLIVHATPHSLERSRRARLVIRPWGRKIFEPIKMFPEETLEFAIMPVIGGLCGSLARALDLPTRYYDIWLKEFVSIDGYEWSGSIARMAAVDGLTELVELPSVNALDAAGFAIRTLGTLSTMIAATPSTQLVASSEVIDRARAKNWPRWPPLRLITSPRLLVRPHSATESDQTATIASGHAADHPQALLAALALVYAGVWPDNAAELSKRLDMFDRTAPHESSVLKKIVSSTRRESFKELRKRRRNQISRMP